jgi:ATP synthase F1 gamma subunit
MGQMSDEINWLKTLGALVVAYEEIAAVRMQRIRSQVLGNRDFLSELSTIFAEVKSSYKRALIRYRIIQKNLKNGRRALVFISANTGLYGDLVSRIFRELEKDLSGGEVVIVGQQGRRLFTEAYPKVPFTFFDLPDTLASPSLAQKITDFLLPFEEVVIYYGVFKNLITQNILATNITGGEEAPAPQKGSLKTIFEPDLYTVLSYFESEIFTSFLIQTLYEAQLARLSARIAVLSQTEDNLKKNLKIALFEKERERHRENNRKQLEMLGCLPLWQR